MQDLGQTAMEAFRRLAARADQRDADRASASSPRPSASDSAPLAIPLELETDPDLKRLRLQHLQELPGTEFLRRDLDLLQQRFDAQLNPKLLGAITTDIRRARTRLDLGIQRDDLQATRPDGCFCLGLGGRHPSFLLIPAGDGEDERTVSTWVDYCSCPDGMALREQHREVMLVRLARITAARVARVFGVPALRDYQAAHLHTVDVLPQNRAAFRRALDWADVRRADVDGSLLLTGPVGTGKTYLAVALLRRRVEQGESALFVTLGDYLQRIRDTFDADTRQSTAEVLTAARTVGLLVFDDLGAKLHLTDWEEGQLYDLVNARITAQLAMILTTNLDAEELRDYLGERIHSRLMGMCRSNVLTWGGADRRIG